MGMEQFGKSDNKIYLGYNDDLCCLEFEKVD